MKYDLIVIGSGPGGITACIYASRSKLKVLMIEKGTVGGKVAKTFQVDNWPGIENISGPDLAKNMFNHALKNNVEYKRAEVKQVFSNGPTDQMIELLDGTKFYSKNVIIATGMIERVPDIEFIKDFNNKGVSFCAICDGFLYKGDVVGVIGGGSSAIEESLFLSNIAKEVHVFVRSSTLHADLKDIDILKSQTNVYIHMQSVIHTLEGNSKLEKIKFIENNKEKEMPIQALFPYIGYNPLSNIVSDLGVTNKSGFIETDEDMETKVKGVYAVGDVREKSIRQITTASSDGTIAAKNIINKL